MRVKIQRGSALIEIDGDFDEVNKVLQAWWVPENDNSEDGSEVATKLDQPLKRARPRRVKPVERSAREGALDVQATVNRIRDDPRFEMIKTKVILGDASRSQRAKFVSWYTHELPLTSGDIQRVLQALGIKMDPATASRAMADAKDDYIKDISTQPATFRLTTRGHAEFEAWLINAG